MISLCLLGFRSTNLRGHLLSTRLAKCPANLHFIFFIVLRDIVYSTSDTYSFHRFLVSPRYS